MVYRTSSHRGFQTTYMPKEMKDLKESYQWQAKSQWKKKLLTNDDIRVRVDLHFGTKRKCDWDNFHKLSFDALTGIVWEDDSQIVEALVRKHYDKDNSRIEITVL